MNKKKKTTKKAEVSVRISEKNKKILSVAKANHSLPAINDVLDELITFYKANGGTMLK